MNAVIIANGEMEANARLQEIWQRAALRIAADGGARNARLFLQRAPHVVIGDMDSLDEETRVWLETSSCEFIRHPRAKDETDLELALLLAQERGAAEITILGAFGGRVDHFLANVFLLTQTKNSRIVGAAGELWIGQGNDVVKGKKRDTVSLIPLDKAVEGITTNGLEYPLRDETLERGSTRGISNVMLGERATVVSDYGTLLIVHLYSTAEIENLKS
ncbi:MAG: thiamine pyrophosphokinase [Chloroflexota bacterium]|nr:MAG: thiamine pyrophosphokinase [Chloroflexota bacterium]